MWTAVGATPARWSERLRQPEGISPPRIRAGRKHRADDSAATSMVACRCSGIHRTHPRRRQFLSTNAGYPRCRRGTPGASRLVPAAGTLIRSGAAADTTADNSRYPPARFAAGGGRADRMEPLHLRRKPRRRACRFASPSRASSGGCMSSDHFRAGRFAGRGSACGSVLGASGNLRVKTLDVRARCSASRRPVSSLLGNW